MSRIPWGGVYAIENIVNGRVYVGSSWNLARRLGQHTKAMKDGAWGNAELRADLKAYGAEAFRLIVLERVIGQGGLTELRQAEAHWAERLNAHDMATGYNVQPIRPPKHLPHDATTELCLLGQRIKQLRILRGFTSQQSFADALGVAQGYVSDIESRNLDLRISTLTRIAQKLGVKPGALLDPHEFKQAAQLAAAVQSATAAAS